MKNNDVTYFLYVLLYLIIVPGLIFFVCFYPVAFIISIKNMGFLTPWLIYFKYCFHQYFFLLTLPFWIGFGLLISYCICVAYRNHAVPDSCLRRYLPFYLPLIYFLCILLLFSFSFNLGENVQEKILLASVITYLPYVCVVFPFVLAVPWNTGHVGVTLFLSYGIGGSLFFKRVTNEPAKHQKFGITVLSTLVIVPMLWVFWNFYQYRQNVLPIDFFTPIVSEREEFHFTTTAYNSLPLPLEEYRPFTENNKLATIKSPSLAIVSETPKLCGSLALYPLYAAAAETVFPRIGRDKAESVVMEHDPYHSQHQDGFGCDQSDIFFTFQPREIEKSKQIPVAKDALVFFVHKDNPLNYITVEALRKIYGKQITTWRPLLGGKRRTVCILPHITVSK